MKKEIFKRTIALTTALAGFMYLGAKDARADFEVSASVQINAPTDFYDPLAAEGAWVDVTSYGRCWHPAQVDVAWRPYCDGSWVWTDCGWYWQSDEPWAWACYHYGSWALVSGVGWVWIPGIEWAPAWVSWREGRGHIGWAPCGPRGAVAADTTFVFVDENHFQGRHRPSDVTVNNTTFINETRVINANNKRESRTIDGRQQTVVVNNGPDVNNLEKVSGKKFQPVPIRDVASHSAPPRSVGHTPGAPAGNTPVNQPAPVNREPPPVVPEHRTTVPQEIPNQPSPSERRLPEEKHEVIPPGPPSGSEVPVRPQPQPVPEPKHDIVPPAHEIPPSHEVPPVHEVPPAHEGVPPHQPAPHDVQPPYPSAPQPQHGEDNKDKDKGKDNTGHD